MTGSERLVQSLLLPINPAAIIILGISTIAWGMWIAAPFINSLSVDGVYNTFLAASPQAISSVLAFITPGLFWGGIAMVCGTLICLGAIRRTYPSLIRGAYISTIHWGVVALLYTMGNAASAGVVFVVTFTVYSAFVYLNLKLNYGKKEMHKQ